MAVRPFGRLSPWTSGGELTMEIHGAIAILTVVTAVIAAWLS
jgi:hypothetical protein